ncbi:MAG: hypothetical protein Q4B06_02775 [Candidatus Saccharibacteria bacterium]|nr:hypothetical protein [Candidatus Saccharibacteria bacterium]
MRLLQYGLRAGLVALVAAGAIAQLSYAADARQFNPGRIIDDAIFTNANSMSVQEIQNFLNSKIGTCDTWGEKRSELGGGTRRQWLESRRNYPPYRCLTDYMENPVTGENNYSKGTPAGAISAAQIIYNYSRQFNINPQVIIATLQKENGLVTDQWPMFRQFTEAMGFGCPDNVAPGAPVCDPAYKSFASQVYQAARHFRGYMDNKPGWYVSFNTGWNTIQWSPNASCGSSSVYIENRATVALYTYTPYRPNQAALNAQYGTGDGCSAYGNRNFFLYFSDWFGSSHGTAVMSSSLKISNDYNSELYTSIPTKASFVVKNNSGTSIDLGTIAIAARDSAGKNYDFGARHVVLSPWQEYRYEAYRTFDKEDTYSFEVVNYTSHYGWNNTYPSAIAGVSRKIGMTQVKQTPTVVGDPVVDNAESLHVGQTTNVRFTVKNNSAHPVNLGYFGLGIGSPSGKNADVPFDTVTSLAAGQEYNYIKPFTPQESGRYNAMVSATLDNRKVWSLGALPAPAPGATNRTSFVVKGSPTLIKGITLHSDRIYAGDKVTGSFTIKNFGNRAVTVNKKLCYIVRPDFGGNYDLGCLDIGTMKPGEELTYRGSRTFDKKGTYRAFFSMFDGKHWYDNWTFDRETGSEPTQLAVAVKDNPTLSQGLMIDNPLISAGNVLTGSFKVRNGSNRAVTVNKKLCYIVRSDRGANNDFGCLDIGVLQPGQELAYKGSRSIVEAGTYRAFFSMFDGKYWYDNWTFDRETGSEPTQLQFTVRDNPLLSQGLAITPAINGIATGSFAVKNDSPFPRVVNKKLCYIVRGGDQRNYDIGCLDLQTLAPHEVKTFSRSRHFPAGTYRAFFSMFDGKHWYDNWTPALATGAEPAKLQFTIR